MIKTRHEAIVQVSYELLCDLLFPKGTVILDGWTDENIRHSPNILCLEVEHPELPEIEPMKDVRQYIKPIYHKIYKGERDNEVDIVEFESWNIKHD
jgi:hypothetical protein